MNHLQPDLLRLLAADIKKPTALVHFQRLGSAVDQRIMTLLIYNAQTAAPDENAMYWMAVGDIMAMIGWTASSNYEAIYEAFRRLKGEVLRWNLFGEDRTLAEEILCSFIITLRIQKHMGRVGYEFHPKLLPIIKSPNVFAKIKLMMIFILANPRYAFPLYELLADALSRGRRTYTMEFANLLEFLGLGSSAYAESWRNFASKILKPACQAINAHSDITVTIRPLRKFRRIEAVEFSVTRKAGWQPPLLPEPMKALERRLGIDNGKRNSAEDQAERDFIASVEPAIGEALAKKAIVQHGLARAVEARNTARAYRDRKNGEVKNFGAVLAKALREGWQRTPEDRLAEERETTKKERKERLDEQRKTLEAIESEVRAERKDQLARIESRLTDQEWRDLRAQFVAELEANLWPSIYRDGFKRSGWQAPGIRIAFSRFMANSFLPPEAESLREVARAKGADYEALRRGAA